MNCKPSKSIGGSFSGVSTFNLVSERLEGCSKRPSRGSCPEYIAQLSVAVVHIIQKISLAVVQLPALEEDTGDAHGIWGGGERYTFQLTTETSEAKKEPHRQIHIEAGRQRDQSSPKTPRCFPQPPCIARRDCKPAVK